MRSFTERLPMGDATADSVHDPVGRTPDDIFEVLGNQRRWLTLYYLHENGARAHLGDLAEHIAAWENDQRLEEISSSERKRVYTSLQQFHLPKMDRSNVVSYDPREGTVVLDDAARDLDVYLEIVYSRDVPWSHFYLALAAFNAILIAAVVARIELVAQVPGVMWAVFVVTVFLFISLVHTYYTVTHHHVSSAGEPAGLDE